MFYVYINFCLVFQMSEMRASGATRNSRTSSKSNEMPRELGICCEKCNNRLVELKRQVMRLILPEIQGVLQSQRKNKNTVCLDALVLFICRETLPQRDLKLQSTLTDSGFFKDWRISLCVYLLFICLSAFTTRWKKLSWIHVFQWRTLNYFTTHPNYRLFWQTISTSLNISTPERNPFESRKPQISFHYSVENLHVNRKMGY